MQALRCGNGHVIDVQFINPSLARCPTCASDSTPVNAITGEAMPWPASLATPVVAVAPVTEPVAEPAVEAPAVEVAPEPAAEPAN